MARKGFVKLSGAVGICLPALCSPSWAERTEDTRDLGIDARQSVHIWELQDEVASLRRQVTDLQAAMRQMRAAQASGIDGQLPGVSNEPLPPRSAMIPASR